MQHAASRSLKSRRRCRACCRRTSSPTFFCHVNAWRCSAHASVTSRPDASCVFAWSLPIFLFFLSTRFSACPESVGTTDPTILPARKVVLALMYAPLDNHKIAFGCIRYALHLFS